MKEGWFFFLFSLLMVVGVHFGWRVGRWCPVTLAWKRSGLTCWCPDPVCQLICSIFFFLSFFFFFFRIYVWLLPYIPCELRDRVGGRMAGLLDIRCLYLFFSLVLCRLDRAQHRTHIPFSVYEATGQFSSSVQLNRSTRTVALATRLKT